MQWLWPDINDIDDAKKIARQGAWLSFVISLVTALVTYLQTSGHIKFFQGLGAEAYIDAGLFLIIGLGMWFASRIAAVAGLLLYAFEQYAMIHSGMSRGSLVAIFFILAFVNAIRASFAYHRFKKEAKAAESPAEAAPADAKKPFPVVRLLGIAVILVLLGAGAWFALPYFQKQISRSSSVSSSETSSGVEHSGSKTFRMKSGDVLRGEVLMEDPEFYVIKSSGKEEVLARTDIVSIE